MAFDPDSYLKEKTQTPAGTFDPDAYLKEKSGDGVLAKAKDFGAHALDYGLRALDYPGGVARTTAAGLMGGVNYLTGYQNPVTSTDVLNTIKGKAPSSAQYMDKFGVPEGAKVDLPLVGDVSARGVGGFLGDVALDPLTYLTGGASAAAKEGGEKLAAKQIAGDIAKPTFYDQVKNLAQRAANPVGNKLDSAGESVYRSAYKVPDAKLAKLGVDPLSDVMVNNGRPRGSASALQTAIDDLTDKKLAEIQGLTGRVDAAGGKVNMLDAMDPAAKRAQEIMRIDPNAGDQVSKMGDWLQNYGREGTEVPLSLATDWKRRIYKSTLPANAYNPLTGRALPVASDIQKNFARGLKTEIENAANKTIPGSGDQISALNSELGPLIESSKKIIPTEVQKDATKNAFTSVDGLVLGDVVNNPLHLPMFLFKKGADIANTPYGRTSIGNSLSNVGKYGRTDALIRRGAIDNNPWAQVDEDKKK